MGRRRSLPFGPLPLLLAAVGVADCSGSFFLPFPEAPDGAESWVLVRRGPGGTDVSAHPVSAAPVIEGRFTEVLLLSYDSVLERFDPSANDCRLASPLGITLVEVKDEPSFQSIASFDALPAWVREALFSDPKSCGPCPRFGELHYAALEPFVPAAEDVRDSDVTFAERLGPDGALVGLADGTFLIARNHGAEPLSEACDFGGRIEPRGTAIARDRYWVIFPDGSLFRIRLELASRRCVIETSTGTPSLGTGNHPFALSSAGEDEAPELFVATRHGNTLRFDGETWTALFEFPSADDRHETVGDVVRLGPGRLVFAHASQNLRFWSASSGVKDVLLDPTTFGELGVVSVAYHPKLGVLAGTAGGSVHVLSPEGLVLDVIEAETIVAVSELLPDDNGFFAVMKGGTIRYFAEGRGYCGEPLGVPGVSTGRRPRLGAILESELFFGDMTAAIANPSVGEPIFGQLLWIEVD